MPEILPHPKRGTMEIGSERIMPIFGQIRAAEGASNDNPVVTIIGTDGSEDRHGSVINPRGWQTAAYLRNPVALWSHGVVEEYPALGQTVSLRSTGGAWEFDIRFALGPWKNMRDNLAQFLWEWFRDFGGPLAASVAFLPKKWRDRQATEMPTYFSENVEYEDQELTEISFVNVPSNRNAIAKAIERARSAGTFTDGMAKMLGFRISPIVIEHGATPLPPVVIIEGEYSQHEGQEIRERVLAALAAHRNGEPLILSDKVKIYADLRSAFGVQPVAAAGERMPLARLRLIVTNTREAMRYCYPIDSCCPPNCVDYCDLCGAMPDCCNCDEVLTGDAATAEQQTIAAEIDALSTELTIALAGWDSAEHDALRNWCSIRVMDIMWGIDRLLRYQDYWYPDNQPADTAAVAADQVRKFIADVEADEAIKTMLTERAIAQSTRIGAELSAKNQARIRAIHTSLTQALDTCTVMLGIADTGDATPAEDGTSDTARHFIRVKSGSPSDRREEGAGQLIRVSASDAPDAGAGGRSTPQDQQDLYGGDVLRVTRS